MQRQTVPGLATVLLAPPSAVLAQAGFDVPPVAATNGITAGQVGRHALTIQVMETAL